MASKKKKGSSLGQKAGVLAAVTAVTAGAYLLTGERGKENRKKVKDFTEKAKKEVTAQAKKAKSEITKRKYDVLVKETVAKYADKAKDIDPQEVKSVAMSLKQQWDDIMKDLQGAPKKKTVKKTTSTKTAKKSATKKAPAKKNTKK